MGYSLDLNQQEKRRKLLNATFHFLIHQDVKQAAALTPAAVGKIHPLPTMVNCIPWTMSQNRRSFLPLLLVRRLVRAVNKKKLTYLEYWESRPFSLAAELPRASWDCAVFSWILGAASAPAESGKHSCISSQMGGHVGDVISPLCDRRGSSARRWGTPPLSPGPQKRQTWVGGRWQPQPSKERRGRAGQLEASPWELS